MKGVILLILLLLAAPALAVQYEKSPGFWSGPGLMTNSDMGKMENRFLQSLADTLKPASMSLIQGQADYETGAAEDDQLSAESTSTAIAEETAPESDLLSTADCGNCTGLNCTGLCVDFNCTGDNCTRQMAGLNCTSLNCSGASCSGICGGFNCTGIVCSICSDANCTCGACPAPAIAGQNGSAAGVNASGESGPAGVSEGSTVSAAAGSSVAASSTTGSGKGSMLSETSVGGQLASSAIAGRFNGFWGMMASKDGFGKEGIKSRTSLNGDFEVDNAVIFHEPAT